MSECVCVLKKCVQKGLKSNHVSPDNYMEIQGKCTKTFFNNTWKK